MFTLSSAAHSSPATALPPLRSRIALRMAFGFEGSACRRHNRRRWSQGTSFVWAQPPGAFASDPMAPPQSPDSAASPSFSSPTCRLTPVCGRAGTTRASASSRRRSMPREMPREMTRAMRRRSITTLQRSCCVRRTTRHCRHPPPRLPWPRLPCPRLPCPCCLPLEMPSPSPGPRAWQRPPPPPPIPRPARRTAPRSWQAGPSVGQPAATPPRRPRGPLRARRAPPMARASRRAWRPPRRRSASGEGLGGGRRCGEAASPPSS